MCVRRDQTARRISCDSASYRREMCEYALWSDHPRFGREDQSHRARGRAPLPVPSRFPDPAQRNLRIPPVPGTTDAPVGSTTMPSHRPNQGTWIIALLGADFYREVLYNYAGSLENRRTAHNILVAVNNAVLDCDGRAFVCLRHSIPLSALLCKDRHSPSMVKKSHPRINHQHSVFVCRLNYQVIPR